MEDRRAGHRSLGTGVAESEHSVPANRGIPATHGGVAESESFDRGIPVQGAGPYKYIPAVRKCKGKNGECKAHPVKDEDFCIGHLRQNDKS